MKLSVVIPCYNEAGTIEFEPEITAKIARKGVRIYEVGDFVPRPDLPEREEDQLERWRPRFVLNREIQCE